MDQTFTEAFRLLAYGICFDALEETLGLFSTVAMESFMQFVVAINNLFISKYLCDSTDEDLRMIVS